MASIALASVGIADTANAQALYAGGATFPSRAYRLLQDCWGFQVDGNPPAGGPTGFLPALPISPACPSPSGDVSGLLAQILYAPVGSGGGKRAFANHDCSSSTSTGLGTPAAANTIPYVSSVLPTYGYPKCHFVGSDDVVIASDIATYDAVTRSLAGNWLQIPALIGPVAVAFNDSGLTIVNAAPAGGTSGLNLSRRAVCGIFSGHITNWNNSILTALNGGTPLNASLAITVVHRSDGSGTNFLFTNALVAQCGSEFGPTSESDPTLVSYAFPWKDDAANLAPSRCNTPPTPNALPIRGANLVGWPDTSPDVCGNTISSPGTFVGGSGNGGVVQAISTTPGAIGYSTSDFIAPVVSGGLKAANVQSQFDIDNGTGQFQPPTAAKAQLAMSSAIPSFDATTRANPLNWSAQLTVPNPIAPGAYPFAGFTMLNFYQCYASSADLNAIFNYLIFHYASPGAAAIIQSQGFATIPTAWFNEVVTLVTSGSTAIGLGNNGACAGHSGI